MKCTVCKEGELNPAYLDVLLPCHTCSHCGGSLLKMLDYFRWQNDHLETNESEAPVEVEAEETSNAVRCPKTGSVMTKYRICIDTNHRLDFSAAINAVWMDKGEWALLKTHGVSGRLNRVFTDHWQQDIRKHESREVMSELYQRRFGEHYVAIKAFRAVLEAVDDRSGVLAYLMADDPYRP